jgi:phosphonate transport system substrate-binding protein
LLRRLRLGEVDLAWLPPVLALTAMPTDATPVALPIRGAHSWFWSALFSNPSSPISSTADLEKAHAVWVNADSASGYLVMRAALRADGINPDVVFAQQSFAQSHDAMVRSVLADERCVGATYLHLDERGTAASAGWGDAEVTVLKRAGPIPADVLAASNELSVAARKDIEAALVQASHPQLNQAAQDLFFASSFARAESMHLAHLGVLGRYLLRERLR